MIQEIVIYKLIKDCKYGYFEIGYPISNNDYLSLRFMIYLQYFKKYKESTNTWNKNKLQIIYY